MPDVVDQETRSRMMAGIRGKNTQPELVIRRGLHAMGFRFRLHAADLPGKPDLVLPRFRAAIFVNGCFWHGHDCHLYKVPSTRPEFWQEKIAGNIARDRAANEALAQSGWRRMIVWECALKGRTRLQLDVVLERIAQWLGGNEPAGEIRGSA